MVVQNNQEDMKMSRILNEYSPFISALSVLLALIFSIFVYCRTRQLLKPKERPIISLNENTAKEQFLIDPPLVKTDLLFIFKNIGEHPANNLRIRIGITPQRNPEMLKNVVDVSVANRIDTNAVFNWNQKFEQPAKQLKEGVAMVTEIGHFIYIIITYEDYLYPEKKYEDEFWLTYTTGKASAGHATIQEKIVLEPYVNSIYKNP